MESRCSTWNCVFTIFMVKSDNRMRKMRTIATWSDFKIRMSLREWSIAFQKLPAVPHILRHLTFPLFLIHPVFRVTMKTKDTKNEKCCPFKCSEQITSFYVLVKRLTSATGIRFSIELKLRFFQLFFFFEKQITENVKYLKKSEKSHRMYRIGKIVRITNFL